MDIHYGLKIRDALQLRSLRNACTFAVMATCVLAPLTLSFAKDDGTHRVASLSNSETAGTIPTHTISSRDFIAAKDLIVNAFDFSLFGDDGDKASVSRVVQNEQGETLTITPIKKPKLAQSSAPSPENQKKLHAENKRAHSIYKRAKRDAYAGHALKTNDAKLYKTIFTLQAAGNMKDANAHIARLGDLRLRGHYLYQRYMHPTAYTTSFKELKNWLDEYANLPGATDVYKLALRKKPAGYDGHITTPITARQISQRREPGMYYGAVYQSPRPRNASDKQTVKATQKSIHKLVKRRQLATAQAQLQSFATHLDNVEFDALQAHIAQGYLYSGDVKQAYRLASASAKRSKEYAPVAGWVAGLASWKNGHYKRAAKFFALTAQSKFSSSWTQSAGAFWAARSYMRAGKSKESRFWLSEAVHHPRTFYGLVATRALGKSPNFNWALPKFTSAHAELLFSTPEGQRAADLVSAGQIHMAEAELLRINPHKNDTKMQEALLAYATHEGLPALAIRAGSAFKDPNGAHYDTALYPVGRWTARENYKVDADLVHAIMRQESRFNARAESHSGALGLMQIMPSTASFISGQKHMKSRTGQEQLLEPQTNIALGQKYIEFLLNDKYVKGDLMSMLAAYNAGPGNLRKWKKRWSQVDDPLLFIELIPIHETREYVEKVLANFWMYRARNGLATPTLDALAKGREALYSDAMRATQGWQSYKLAAYK